jgi:hypothetical protein
MRSLPGRPQALPVALALAFATVLLLAGSQDVFWTGDFYLEVYPAYERLMDGDAGGFLDRRPATAASRCSSAVPPRC